MTPKHDEVRKVKTKKENKVIEIHIYVHQVPAFNPNGTNDPFINPPYNPKYHVTC